MQHAGFLLLVLRKGIYIPAYPQFRPLTSIVADVDDVAYVECFGNNDKKRESPRHQSSHPSHDARITINHQMEELLEEGSRCGGKSPRHEKWEERTGRSSPDQRFVPKRG